MCDAHHSHRLKGGTKMPKRVLDVQCLNSSKGLRLLDTAGIWPGADMKYVVLSHCWGREQPVRLLTTNIEQMRKCIDRNMLPALFEDAVEVTRYMEVRYLLMDALCIIQDDPDDWEVESAKMGGGYEDAYVTIAASSSANGGQPFLDIARDRVLSGLTVRNYGGKESDSWRPPVYVRTELHVGLDQDKPVEKRAWAFQEYMAISRIIQFTRFDISFICKQGMHCECGETSLSFHPSSANEKYLSELAGALNGGRRKWRSMSVEQLHSDEFPDFEIWSTIVEMYSVLSLTFISDRVPGRACRAVPLRMELWQGLCSGVWRLAYLGLVEQVVEVPKCSGRPVRFRQRLEPRESDAPLPLGELRAATAAAWTILAILDPLHTLDLR